MNITLLKIVGAVFFVCASTLVAGPKVHPVSKEVLLQAVDSAKKGDRAKLHEIANSEYSKFSEELLPDLIGMLNEKDAQIQLIATRGLNVIKSKKSKDALVDYLKGKDYVKLEKSLRKGELAPDQYLWQIQSAVQTIMALGEIGDKSVIPLLESLRNIKDIHNLEGAGSPVESALVNLGADGFKSLGKLGKNADGKEISRAAEAISSIRKESQLPSLVSTVKDDSCAEEVRAASVSAIAKIQGSNSLPYIVSIIRENKYPAYVRGRAIFEASKYGYNEGGEAAVEELVEDAGSGIRPDGMFYLAKMSPEKHLVEAIEFMMDTNQPLAERERLSMYFDIRKTNPAMVRRNKEMFIGCLKAVKVDGTPADQVRSYIWLVLYEATGEAYDVELSGKDAGAAEIMLSRLKDIYTKNCHANSAGDYLQAQAMAKEVFMTKVRSVGNEGGAFKK